MLRSTELHTLGLSSSLCFYSIFIDLPHSFGVPAVLLELVPFAGIFFTFTNTVGAALWAADMEQTTRTGESTTAPNLRNQAEQIKKSE